MTIPTSTAQDLADLKAAPASALSILFDGSIWNWSAGNFTGRNDDIYIVEADSVSIDAGAWLRQSAGEITAGLPTTSPMPNPPLHSQADLNTLSMDLLQFIPRDRWDAIRQGTSTYPEDDAFDQAMEWIEARMPTARLTFGGRRIYLSRSHVINVRRVVPDFSGVLDFAGLPADAEYALELTGRSHTDNGGAHERSVTVRGLYLRGNGNLITDSNRAGISLRDIDHVRVENYTVRDFGHGVRLRNDAYILTFSAGSILACRHGFYNVLEGVNAGERISFLDTTFGGCGTAVHQNNGFGDTYLSNCSIDYPNGWDGPNQCRFLNLINGRLVARDCHFEGNNQYNTMGALSAFYCGGDGAAMELHGEVVFNTAFPNYMFENHNPNAPMEVDVWMYNAAGTAGRLGTGSGPINVALRTPQGGGVSTSAGLLNEASNRAMAPNFSTLGNVTIWTDQQEDGSDTPTSPTNGRTLAISRSADVDMGDGGSLKMERKVGPGLVSTLLFAVPLENRNAIGNAAISLAKPGNEAGLMYIDARYGTVRRDANGVFVADRITEPFHVVPVYFDSNPMPISEFRLEGSSTRAPGWATHMLLRVDFNPMPVSTVYAGRFLVTELA